MERAVHNRCYHDVAYDVLALAMRGATKQALLAGGFSGSQLKRVLEDLVDEGLVGVSGTGHHARRYSTTAKGELYMSAYTEIRMLFSPR